MHANNDHHAIMSSTPPHRSIGAFTGSAHLREALRAMRHVAMMGRNNVAQAAGRAGSPIADMAQFAIGQADRIAFIAEDVVERVLADPTLAVLETELAENGASANRFAAAAYMALRQILRQFGAEQALVSELRLRRAFSEVGARTDETGAAVLMRAMLRQAVVSHAKTDQSAGVEGDEIIPLAIFALMLFMLSERDASEAEEALRSSVMLSLALRQDIAETVNDEAAIATLLEEFRNHV